MKKTSKLFSFFCVFLFMNALPLAAEQIIIKSRLFKGIKEERKPTSEIVISSFSQPFLAPINPSYVEQENQAVALLKNELNSLYQLKDVDHLLSSSMIWDGKRKNLIETILLDEFSYPISLSPKVLSQNDVKLRIEVFKLKGTGISFIAKEAMVDKKSQSAIFTDTEKIELMEGSREKLLDTEIITKFDEPVVLGFPSNGNPYFLSLLVTKKITADVMKSLFSGDKTEIDILTPPQAVHNITPVYPLECKEQKIEGEVILQVSADKAGNVTSVRVLRHAHPDLDKAAVEALKQWKYEPVLKNGKPIPVVFAVKVDFKLRESTPESKTESISPANFLSKKFMLNGEEKTPGQRWISFTAITNFLRSKQKSNIKGHKQ